MLIDAKHAEVLPLIKRWNSMRSPNPTQKERKSHDLRRQLMLDIVEPKFKRYEGELILLYHTFLSMRPSGVHSFAHGSEMVSDTVYWVTVGRIDGTKLRRIRAQTHEVGARPFPLRFYTAPQFLVPLRSASVSLAPRYARDSHQPHFVIRERAPNETALEPSFMLDISAIGNCLFALRRDKNDWATEVEIVLGTKSVRAWLAEHGSEETYQALRKRL